MNDQGNRQRQTNRQTDKRNRAGSQDGGPWLSRHDRSEWRASEAHLALCSSGPHLESCFLWLVPGIVIMIGRVGRKANTLSKVEPFQESLLRKHTDLVW